MVYKIKRESAIFKNTCGGVLLLKSVFPEFSDSERIGAAYKRLRDKCFECAKIFIDTAKVAGVYRLSIDTEVEEGEYTVVKREIVLASPDGKRKTICFEDIIAKDDIFLKKHRKVVKNKHLFRHGIDKI